MARARTDATGLGPLDHQSHSRKDEVVTPILAPTTANTSTADQIIETLATYIDEHTMALGGDHQRTMLLAALLTRLFDVPAHDAIDLARNGSDPRVTAAGQARDEILTRAARNRLALESWTPTPGDVVTRNGMNGTWIVSGWEDDDTVWIHRPNVAMVPAYGRTSSGLTDLTPGRREPAHEELAAVAELRPAATAEVTV